MNTVLTTPIRILIADDHGMVRFGLRGYIETMPGLQVVGEAATGEEVLELLETQAVDILSLIHISICLRDRPSAGFLQHYPPLPEYRSRGRPTG